MRGRTGAKRGVPRCKRTILNQCDPHGMRWGGEQGEMRHVTPLHAGIFAICERFVPLAEGYGYARVRGV